MLIILNDLFTIYVRKVMHSQKCYNGVKTQIFPLIIFIDTVRDIYFA